jgi:DOMON domain
VFWVNQVSGPIEIVNPGEESTVPPVAPDSSFYEGCDVTKTCFGIGQGNCVQNRRCNTVGAVIFDEGKFYFEMRSSSKNLPIEPVFTIEIKNALGQARYVAFALSYDTFMGNDSVIECVNDAGRVRAYTSFTTRDNSPRIQV